MLLQQELLRDTLLTCFFSAQWCVQRLLSFLSIMPKAGVKYSNQSVKKINSNN